MSAIMSGLSKLERVLILEDHVPLRRAIALMARGWGAKVLEAGTAREALELLYEAPDLLIADICLPDGSALAVLEATLNLSPEPLKIGISGNASAEQAFQLAQLGVRAYLPKPFSLGELKVAVERALTEAPKLDPLVRASVGRVPMREVQDRVRQVMIDQAFALADGSRSGAARLLDVSRQAMQQIARQKDRGGDPAAQRSENEAPESPRRRSH